MKPQPVKRLIVLIGLLALVGGIVLSCGGLENQPLEPVTAKVVKKAEPLKKIKTKYSKHEPLAIWKNKTIFAIKGAKAGIKIGHYNRFKGIKYFENRCPYCTKRGYKSWNTIVYNKKMVHEGELTCSRCDSDFDCYTGYEKSGNKRYKLKLVKWKK